MICYTTYALLAVGLASQALAEPFGGPEFARMSTRDVLGLQRRAVEGYAPTEELCGAGNTCAQACGKGFRQCASTDGLTHCYNRLKKQTCCPGGSGDSCDNGYYCSADEHEKTWCCPDGLSLEECAKKYDIPGSLTSESPSTSTTKTKTTTKAKPTTTKETTTTSTAEPSTTSTKEPTSTSTKSRKPETTESTSTTKTKHHTTTSKSSSEETSTSTTTTTPTSTSSPLIDLTSLLLPTDAAAGTDVTALGSETPSTPAATAAPSSTSSAEQGGSSRYEPVNGLILFIAGAMAAVI